MKNILYVEDNKDTAQAVKLILTKEGYNTDIAHNGKTCIEKAQTKKYDLYLLDIMLPDMSGWAIFEYLQKKTKAKIAFLSAIPLSHERLEELTKAGIAGYIAKPFTKTSLLKNITNIINKK